MRQEFASESKPKTGSNASVSLTKRTQFNRGAGKSLNIVFSRGLRAARTGGVVAAIPFACHTVRRRQRKNLLPINPPLGFSLGTVTTTETLSTEATPEHHRGCFNAPKFPVVLDSDLPSPRPHTRHPRPRSGTSATYSKRSSPAKTGTSHLRLSGAGRNPGGWVGSPSVAHEEVGPATSRNRHPRQMPEPSTHPSSPTPIANPQRPRKTCRQDPCKSVTHVPGLTITHVPGRSTGDGRARHVGRWSGRNVAAFC